MNPYETRPRPAPPRKELIEQRVSEIIVACLFEVHNALGFGFLESVYCRAMEVALLKRGLKVRCEVPVTVMYDGVDVGLYRIDMLVEDRIILEIKASEKLSEVPKLQVRNYLAASKLELGLVLHFGPRAAFHRVLAPRN